MSTGFEREGQYGGASHPIVLRRPRHVLGGGNRRRTTGRIQPVVATPLTKEVFMWQPAVWGPKFTGRARRNIG